MASVEAATSPSVLYGNCHCGRHRFQLAWPHAGPVQRAVTCTCRLCAKQGYLWLEPQDPDAFRLTRDDKLLTVYRSPTLQHSFCSHCGTGLTGTHADGPHAGRLLVNARALADVDPFQLVATTEEAARDAPVSDAPAPAPAGSCACGNVSVQLLVPLGALEAKEDNCSICTKNAWVGVYPTKDQVRLAGQAHTTDYQYGRGVAGFPFCSTCGVHVWNSLYGPPQEVLDRIPPARRDAMMAMVREKLRIQPVNVRALDGVDWAALAVERTHEGTEGYTVDA